MVAQPTDELHDFAIAPHPRREARECLLRVLPVPGPTDPAVESSGVGPIGLGGDDREASVLDQLPGDPRPHAVELRRPVGRLTDEHEAAPADPVQERGEIGIVQLRERLGGGRYPLGQRDRDPIPV